MEAVMERSLDTEARLLLLERHVAFNGALGEKVDRQLSEIRNGLRRIHTLAESLEKGHFDLSTQNTGRFAATEGLVTGVGKQARRIDERVADIEVKVDQLITLMAPPPLVDPLLSTGG
jgi:hypothetical protein